MRLAVCLENFDRVRLLGMLEHTESAMDLEVGLSQMDPYWATLELLSGALEPSQCIDLSPEERRQLRRQLSAVTRWHRAGFITGFGLAPKLVNSFPMEVPSCRIYIRSKRRNSVLRPSERIPSQIHLVGVSSPVLLDVIECPPPIPSVLTFPQRPIFPGLSVGHCASGETGSIGALCRLAGDRVLLSASHVIAVSGLASRKDPIIQPGGDHGGACPQFTVGRLEDVIPLQAGSGYPNLADAAIAILDSHIGQQLGSPPIVRFATPAELQPGITTVTKVGASTGVQSGIISDLHFRCLMPHRSSIGQIFLGFQEQIAYNALSVDGDSGGPLITQDGALVGIHTGRAGSFAVATPIWNILGRWNLTPL